MGGWPWSPQGNKEDVELDIVDMRSLTQVSKEFLRC